MERVGVGRGRWLEQMSEKGESSRIDGSAHTCPLLTPNTRPAIWSRVQVGDASGVRACGGGGRRRGRSGVGWWWRERALAGEGGACVLGGPWPRAFGRRRAGRLRGRSIMPEQRVACA